MFLQIVEPSVKRQPGFRPFTYFFRHASRLSTGIDAIADIKKDYPAGRTQVLPTIKNRAIMARQMLPETVEGVRAMGLPMATEILTRAAYKIAKDRERG